MLSPCTRTLRRAVLAAAVLASACIHVAVASAALTPAQIHRAYDLPERAKTPRTIAVVVANDVPRAEQDLATYSKHYKLPACTTRNRCFRKVNEDGATTPLPPPDASGGNWIGEAILGTQVAHAVCQNCRILLVETKSDAPADLAAGVGTAVRLGARVVATQYLLPDDPSFRNGYDHPGVVITAATGDNGYFGGLYAPAALASVVAVGGTRLHLRKGRYSGETVWNEPGTGTTTSGCGVFSAVPAWQVREAQIVGCGSQRSVADIAAVASPGARVYTSARVLGVKGWIEEGGTSLASPLVAATFALAGGVPRGVSAGDVLYRNYRAHRGGLRDIVKGSNGRCASAMCRARRGYDGPTGIGTPKGLAAFRWYGS